MASQKECKTGFVWSPELETFDFGKRHPIKVGRFQMIHDFLLENNFFNIEGVGIIKPEPLPEDLLHRIHASSYIDHVRKISRTGVGDIDIDTPGFKGIYKNGRIISGATISGVDAVLQQKVNHFFSPTGGFHHATYEWGGGFCIFNDIAAAVFRLKDYGFQRILIADFDVHHGNGTQKYFYRDSGVMQISFHEDPEWMYPHDGYIKDIGEGPGKGYNINMHFPMNAGDDVYRYAFDQLVPSLIDFYQPEFILFLPGFDAHYLDPLTHMNLTTEMIRYVAEFIHIASHRFSEGRLGVLSGGGYHPESFRWGTSTVMSVLTGQAFNVPEQAPPFEEDDEETWETVQKNVEEVKDIVFTSLGI